MPSLSLQHCCWKVQSRAWHQNGNEFGLADWKRSTAMGKQDPEVETEVCIHNEKWWAQTWTWIKL